MNPIVPVEVQERIIDHLWDDSLALTRCRLTCRTWLPAGSLHFFRAVRIDKASNLKDLLQTLSREQRHPLNQRARTLLCHYRVEEADGFTPYLLPHYLARKFPGLTDLYMVIKTASFHNGTTVNLPNPALPFHKSLPTHFAQFRNLNRLALTNFRFPSLNDLRRTVGALPKTTQLAFENVIWDDHDPERLLAPLLRATNWKVKEIQLRHCHFILGFAFWASPPITAPRISYAGLLTKGSHPAISHHDIHFMNAILLRCRSPDFAFLDLVWEYDASQGLCKSYLPFLELECLEHRFFLGKLHGHDVKHEEEKPSRFTFSLEPDQSHVRYSEEEARDVPTSTIVRAFDGYLGLNSVRTIRSFEWEQLDKLFPELSGLVAVRIEADLLATKAEEWEQSESSIREHIVALMGNTCEVSYFELQLNQWAPSLEYVEDTVNAIVASVKGSK